MSITERIHAQPRHKVEILLAFEVVEENAFPALKANGIAIVGGEKKALFEIGDLIEARHAFNCKTNGLLGTVSGKLRLRLVPRSYAGKDQPCPKQQEHIFHNELDYGLSVIAGLKRSRVWMQNQLHLYVDQECANNYLPPNSAFRVRAAAPSVPCSNNPL
jgi:hypothetical protein